MGTIRGVFIPCSLTILSVVLFLRMAYIIGEGGIFHSILLLIFCCFTTFLTVLSMNAIITNGKIRAGGVYYVASRSLGSSAGGAIGLLYYVATSFSTSIAILGAIEALIISTKWTIISFEFSIRFYSMVLLAILSSMTLAQ